ncbi:MAG: T9SS type A sorting domain-containing protein [Paludibacter sp.]|nr:T9SS type A sorting domain-containing protein [Paludibacter sp.]
MKKKLLSVTLALCALFAFSQETISINRFFQSSSLINKMIPDSMHSTLEMKLIMNGTVVQEEIGLQKSYSETEPEYGNEIKSWSFSKDKNSIDYVKNDSMLYNYDDNGRRISKTYYQWEETTGEWVWQSNAYYTYSGDTIITSSDEGIDDKELVFYKNGLQDSTLRFEKDGDGVWKPSSSSKYSYNVESNPVLIIDYSYDETNQTFEPTMKADYIYGIDVNGKNYCYGNFLFWDGTMWTDTTDYQNGMQLVQSIELTIYYTMKQVKAVVNRSKTTEANTVSIYPNPTTEGIYINSDMEMENTISIYNLNGSKILCQKVKGNEYVPVSGLPDGIYIITVSNQNGTFKEKLIKE